MRAAWTGSTARISPKMINNVLLELLAVLRGILLMPVALLGVVLLRPVSLPRVTLLGPGVHRTPGCWHRNCCAFAR